MPAGPLPFPHQPEPPVRYSPFVALCVSLLLLTLLSPAMSVEAEPRDHITAEVSPEDPVAEAGDRVRFTITATNTGDETYDIKLRHNVDFYAPRLHGYLPQGANHTLPGGSTLKIPAQVNVSQDIYDNWEWDRTGEWFWFDFWFQVDQETSVHIRETRLFVQLPPPQLRLEINPERLEIERGETGEYNVRVHNDGEVLETITLMASGFGDRVIMFDNDPELQIQRNITLPPGETWETKIHLPTEAARTNVNQTSTETITVTLFTRAPYDHITMKPVFIVHITATEDRTETPSRRPALAFGIEQTRYTMQPGENRDFAFELWSNSTDPGSIKMSTETAPYLEASIVEGDHHRLESRIPLTLHARITVADEAPPGPQSTTLYAVRENGYTERLVITIHIASADPRVEPLPPIAPIIPLITALLAFSLLRKKQNPA